MRSKFVASIFGTQLPSIGSMAKEKGYASDTGEVLADPRNNKTPLGTLIDHATNTKVCRRKMGTKKGAFGHIASLTSFRCYFH